MKIDGRIIYITGAAGFIGAKLAQELLERYEGITVVGIDNMNDYYDVSLKEYRLELIEETAAATSDNKWVFIRKSIADKVELDNFFAEYDFDI